MFSSVFGGLSKAMFKKDAAGNHVFFPWGIFAAGVIVNTEEKRATIQGFLSIYYGVGLPIIAATTILKSYWFAGAVVCGMMLVYVLFVRLTLRDLPRSKERMTLLESYRNSARTLPLPLLVMVDLGSIGFTVVSVAMLADSRFRETGQVGMAIAGLLFFGLGSIVFSYLIFIKLRKRP
jgi:hypothetical protein